MCLIIALDQKSQYPEPDEIAAAAHSNPDGIGIAWSDDRRVHWEKGVDWNDVAYGLIYNKLKNVRPLVMHFRLATVGEPSTKLCHPFHISKFSPLSTSGTSKRAPVLFHNGHYGNYDRLFTFTHKLKSDSHALAAYAGLHGIKMLDAPAFYWQRICVLSRHNFRLFGKGWMLGEHDNIWRSNENHLYDDYSQYGYGCAYYPGEKSNAEYRWDESTATYVKRDAYDNPVDEFDPSLGMWAEGEDGKWRFVPWDEDDEKYVTHLDYGSTSKDEYYVRALERKLERLDQDDDEWDRYGG